MLIKKMYDKIQIKVITMFNNILSLFIKSIIIYFLVNQNISYAYLDPGTGGSLLQIVLALLAGIGSFLGFYWRKTLDYIKNFIKKFKKAEKK